MDLRTRVVSLEHHATLSSQRLSELEKWQRVSDIADARKDEQFKNMDLRFTSIDKKIDEIGGTLKWVNPAIITGIIRGAVGFIVKGGFNLP
jgi:L-lactate utilization protein LutB